MLVPACNTWIPFKIEAFHLNLSFLTLCARLRSLMSKVALVQSLKGPWIIPLVESIKSRSCVTTKCVHGGLGVSLVPLKRWGPSGGGDISWVWHWNGPQRTQMGPHYEPTNLHREQHCLMDTQVDKHWHDLALERWNRNLSPEISLPKIHSNFCCMLQSLFGIAGTIAVGCEGVQIWFSAWFDVSTDQTTVLLVFFV